MLRVFLQVALWIYPWRVRRWMLNKLLHFEIDPTAKIGFSVITAGTVRMGPYSRVGHLTAILRLISLELGPYARIGNLNYVYGVSPDSEMYRAAPNRRSILTLGQHSSITNRHLVDCTDSVTLEEFCTVAGYHSVILTHSIDFRKNVQSCGPIRVGRQSFVGTNCVLLRDASIPSRSLVAAGAVVTGKVFPESSILGGVPATKIGDVGADWEHFNKTVGHVL